MRCNICESIVFERGPSDRLAENGELPQCAQCKSLERHRAIRSFFQGIDSNCFRGFSALQFSWDPSLDKESFKDFTTSFYGGLNSLDIQKLELYDGSFDFVFLSHIIEFVKDDILAFSELVRIVSERGLLMVCFAYPRGQSSVHWALGDGPHGAYHRYGKDRFEYFGVFDLGLTVLEVIATDPVTGCKCEFDLFSKNKETVNLALSGCETVRSLHYLGYA